MTLLVPKARYGSLFEEERQIMHYPPLNVRMTVLLTCFAMLLTGTLGAIADSEEEAKHEEKQSQHEDRHKEYITGTPIVPTDDWVLASGGRLYDNWMAAQQADEPERTHPSWPTSNAKKKGATTWRCKSCHGWDYKGAQGKYASGSYKTGIPGVIHKQGFSPDGLIPVLRNKTHQYTEDMISDDAAPRFDSTCQW